VPAATSAWHLRQAARTVRVGGIVAYPTEAVFGLGCDPLNGAAVQRILRGKRRAAAKGLILIAAELQQLQGFVGDFPEHSRERILDSWPGPVTWILPAAAAVPQWLTGGRPTLAVRVTAHPVASALCHACGTPLVSTSANFGGRPPARTPIQVRLRLAGLYDLLVPGHTGPQRRPSTLVDASSGRILRP
jgi:L-threonylcarbamoyladenylate synthase